MVEYCKWSKYRPSLSHIATAVAAEDTYRNRSPSRNSIKRAKQRNRYIPWYHKLHLRANSAIINSPQEYFDFHACTALDLNADGTRLTSASALKGPDKLLWEKAHGEEIVRLIESKTGRFIHRHEMPPDRKLHRIKQNRPLSSRKKLSGFYNMRINGPMPQCAFVLVI